MPCASVPVSWPDPLHGVRRLAITSGNRGRGVTCVCTSTFFFICCVSFWVAFVKDQAGFISFERSAAAFEFYCWTPAASGCVADLISGLFLRSEGHRFES